MLRHRLAALFEPRSLLVLSERDLPIAQNPSPSLQGNVSFVRVAAHDPIPQIAEFGDVSSDVRLDTALVCVDPARLPDALDALRALRPRAVIVLASSAPATRPIQDLAYCRAWGRLHDCLILGPRAFGLQRPQLGINFSHAANTALPGRVALVAQSRSVVAAVMDWAADIHAGFSTVISLGDEATVTVPQVLDYLAMDPHTDSIALYLDHLSSPRELASALRAAAGVKPVVVLKSGYTSSELGLAQDAVLNALLRRAGAVRIRYFVQLFSALKVLGYTHRPRGRRIALFSNGRGATQLALDVMNPAAAVFRAELSQTTINSLEEWLAPEAPLGNPVVTHAPLQPKKVNRVVQALLDDAGVDGVLILLAPDPLSDMPAVARQLALLTPNTRKPIITCFMGDAGMRPLRHLLDDVGTPAFRTPESAANAFGILATYHYNQVLSQQTLPPEPLGKPADLDTARAVINEARLAARLELTPIQAQRLFDCFHIPIQAASAQSGGQLVDNGPPMAIHVNYDASLGPYIRFGSGGADALISNNDRAIDLPPLNSYLARQLIERSTLWRRVLAREMSPVAFEWLQESLERISDLISELPGIDSVVVDPLFAGDHYLSARAICIHLSASAPAGLPETTAYRHMAIHPYPRQLVQARVFADGRPWMMRPIRPEDAEPLQTFMRGLSDQSRYMRFVSMLRELTPRMLARFTRIDYDRELALVATVQVPNPQHRGHPHEQIIGFAHYLRNADGRGAEYALVIGDDWQRRGLGGQLMGGLIVAAREQGLAYVDGVVLASNRAMLRLMTRLGFQDDADPQDPGMRRVWLNLKV